MEALLFCFPPPLLERVTKWKKKRKKSKVRERNREGKKDNRRILKQSDSFVEDREREKERRR